MKKSSIRIFVPLCVLAAVIIAGCVSTNLKMKRETIDWQQEKAMVLRSLERFDEGDFYVYEWSGLGMITAAIVVDVKDDDKTIRPGTGWKKIKTREELEKAYKSGSMVKAQAGMRLYRIEGDDGEIWGYFFAPRNILPYTMVNDNTIELGQIPEPKAPGV